METFNRTLNIFAQVQRTLYSEWNTLQVSTRLAEILFQKLGRDRFQNPQDYGGLRLAYLLEKPLYITALNKPLLNSTQYFTTHKIIFFQFERDGCFNSLNTFKQHFGANCDQSFLEIIINISYFFSLGQRDLIVNYPQNKLPCDNLILATLDTILAKQELFRKGLRYPLVKGKDAGRENKPTILGWRKKTRQNRHGPCVLPSLNFPLSSALTGNQPVKD